MTNDEAFFAAGVKLDEAARIWKQKRVAEYPEAEKLYSDAVKIRTKYFDENNTEKQI